jgi:NADPH:quinone reductase-like Zn-dependent oxidoreductase
MEGFEKPATVIDVTEPIPAGDDVDGFARGDRVLSAMGMRGSLHDGSFGELSTPQAASLALTPDELTDGAASTLGVAGAT